MSARIALIRPLDGWPVSEFQEPLGAEAICGYLRERGIECRVFDRVLDKMLGRDTVQAVLDYAPTLVGFSLMTLREAEDGARLATLLPSKTRLCAGGILPTTNPKLVQALFPPRTRLVGRAGERMMLYLAVGAPSREPTPDQWAFASRDELAEYLRFGGVINIRSSIGCPGKCTFCATPYTDPVWRGRDVSLVALEMEYLSRTYEPIFNFTDDTFGPPERVLALIEELKKRACRAAFSLELRAGDLIRCDLRTLKAMHEGGLCRIFTGLESTEPHAQESWRKPVDVPAFFDAVSRCREAGIEPAVGTILFHRLSSPESVRREGDLLRQNGLFDPRAALSRMILYPGCLRADGTVQKPTPEPLAPDTQRLYDTLSRNLAPLFARWQEAACRLPGALCRDFLSGRNDSAPLRHSLAGMNEECWTYFSSLFTG